MALRVTETNSGRWPLKWLIRGIFLALPLVSAAQYQFIGSRLGETYPAVVMPIFGGDGGYSDGKVKVGRLAVVFITPGGDRLSFTPKELLSEFPDGHHASIASMAFAPLDAVGDSPPARQPLTGFKSTLEAVVYRTFPGLRIGQRNDPRVGESLRAWLRHRADVLAPGRAVDAIAFNWSVDTFSTVSGQFAVDHQDAGSLVVQLGGT